MWDVETVESVEHDMGSRTPEGPPYLLEYLAEPLGAPPSVGMYSGENNESPESAEKLALEGEVRLHERRPERSMTSCTSGAPARYSL